MQPLRRLSAALASLAGPDRYLFAAADLRSAVPDLSQPGFKVLLSRAAAGGVLQRVCRGIYLYPQVAFTPGLVVPHTAARLRSGHLLYLSLESSLSEHGVISQVPLDRLTLMTSGRSGVIDCGRWGVIEFTHTAREVSACRRALSYDPERRLWVATAALAAADLRRVGRNVDLIDTRALQEADHG